MKKLKKLSLQKETLLNLRVAAAGPQQNVDKPDPAPAPDTHAPCLDPETIFY